MVIKIETEVEITMANIRHCPNICDRNCFA